ncbi:MAG: hypothetical protein HQK59_17895 [Deltaproteobacteria bacterium]|nr:hypothetical protein [Deltaproteobacteria bacterium]
MVSFFSAGSNSTLYGQTLYGVEVGKTIDVDHPEDLAKAEAFLKETTDR